MLIVWHIDPQSNQLVLGQFFGVRNVNALRREIPKKNGLVEQVMQWEGPSTLARKL